jgi:hypothetical protein
MVINKVQIPFLLIPKKEIHRKVEPVNPSAPVQQDVPRLFTPKPVKSKKRK